ncbi:Uncharacterised protein [uncultured archaeon]|nr:Uncharacterised protein [uncultured archaeon]
MPRWGASSLKKKARKNLSRVGQIPRDLVSSRSVRDKMGVKAQWRNFSRPGVEVEARKYDTIDNMLTRLRHPKQIRAAVQRLHESGWVKPRENGWEAAYRKSKQLR